MTLKLGPSDHDQPDRRHRQSFSALSESEGWIWHANVYAFRRVILGIPDATRTSPCDEEGVWFDPQLVEEATQLYRQKYHRNREERRRLQDRTAELEGRAIANQWVRDRGFANIDAYATAKGIDWSDAYRECIASILTTLPNVQSQRGGKPEDDAMTLDELRRELGVDAKPAEFNPSAEAMRQARQQLRDLGNPLAPEQSEEADA